MRDSDNIITLQISCNVYNFYFLFHAAIFGDKYSIVKAAKIMCMRYLTTAYKMLMTVLNIHTMCAAIYDRKLYHLGNCINKSNMLYIEFYLYIANLDVSCLDANDKIQRLVSIHIIL